MKHTILLLASLGVLCVPCHAADKDFKMLTQQYREQEEEPSPSSSEEKKDEENKPE